MSNPDQSANRESEWALMLRGLLVLFCKKFSVDPLVDDDFEFERARNTYFKKSKEQHRIDYTPTVLERLQKLKRNFCKSFLFLTITIAAASLVSYLCLGLVPNPIGVASLFFLGWPTLEKLGYSIKSFGGETVVERLDDFIFQILFLFGTFLGIVALA
jgi:hypothetical protein